MVKIKICGIKRIQDVEYVNILMPDYVGFVFAESKRKVTFKDAEYLINNMDKKIKKAGVFVNEDINNLSYISDSLKLDIIQLHGNEDDDYIKRLKAALNNKIVPHIWKAYGFMNKQIINPAKIIIPNDACGIVCDSLSKDSFGGTGNTFDWDNIHDLKKKYLDKKIILAGGLNSSNVANAIKIVNPYAVDVSSGVEENGVKSFDKIKDFILKVREIQ